MGDYLALWFRRDNDSGIARVDIYDETSDSYLVLSGTIDLYEYGQVALSNMYSPLVARYSIDREHEYTVTVTNTKTHNASAVGPNYNVSYQGYTYEYASDPAYTVMKLYASDGEREYEYASSGDSSFGLCRQILLTGDGTTTTFIIGGTDILVRRFKRFTFGKEEWHYPSSIMVNWGSNPPDYDNEIITSGSFTIQFVEPPMSGSTPVVEVMPVIDSARAEITLYEEQDIMSVLDVDLGFIQVV